MEPVNCFYFGTANIVSFSEMTLRHKKDNHSRCCVGVANYKEIEHSTAQSSQTRWYIIFYATLAYIRHFIFAGCYDNDPWYQVTNFAGHLDLAGHFDFAGFYFSKCPANSKPPAFSSCDGGSPSLNIMFLPGLEHTPPLSNFLSVSLDRKLMLYQ
jgi:hypothetical protein